VRLSILSGAAGALVALLASSCGGSDFTGQSVQPLPDASAGGSLGDAGSGGDSGANGASGDSGHGGDSGTNGTSGDSGSGGASAAGASGTTTTDSGAGSGGVIGIDASPDANCASPMAFFPDLDGDGYGTQGGVIVACEQPPGAWVTRAGDCNDALRDVNPEQKNFFGVGYDARSALQFDYDCNGREEPDPSQFGPAPDCTRLLGACTGSGFAPNNRTGTGVDPLCGSTALVQCKVMEVILCGSVVTQVAPKRCR
jgi:hypothetical protein